MAVHHSPVDCASAVLHFWFDEVGEERWFAKSDALDGEIRRRFGRLHAAIVKNRAAEWRSTPDHLLAAVLILDQFSRNIHRGKESAFVGDAAARELTLIALERGWDQSMTPERRQFLLMPLMHSEKLADQQRSLVEYGRLGRDEQCRYARLHHDQIERFGRFPGRNAALGRRTTENEQEALDAGAAF